MLPVHRYEKFKNWVFVVRYEKETDEERGNLKYVQKLLKYDRSYKLLGKEGSCSWFWAVGLTYSKFQCWKIRVIWRGDEEAGGEDVLRVVESVTSDVERCQVMRTWELVAEVSMAEGALRWSSSCWGARLLDNSSGWSLMSAMTRQEWSFRETLWVRCQVF